MLKFKNYKGFGFIGDPHIWSKKPGFRTDLNFPATVLNKLEQCFKLCKEHNVYPIILGDLFHTDKECDIDLLTKLTRLLHTLPEPCATVEGNHEKSQTKLSDDVAITMLRESKSIYTIEKDGLWAVFEIEGQNVLVCSTPYGTPIPTKFEKPEKYKDSKVIWLTHHDLDFGETYPGVIPIHEIENVDMLVNGHIHKTKDSKKVGNMMAHNPGNITRLSTDCADHIPSLWIWTPEQEFNLKRIPLQFEKVVFFKPSEQIVVEKATQIVDELKPEDISKFVTEMELSSQTQDHQQTDDGAHIKNSILALAKAKEVGDDFTKDILSIAEETINEITSGDN